MFMTMNFTPMEVFNFSPTPEAIREKLVEFLEHTRDSTHFNNAIGHWVGVSDLSDINKEKMYNYLVELDIYSLLTISEIDYDSVALYFASEETISYSIILSISNNTIETILDKIV